MGTKNIIFQTAKKFVNKAVRTVNHHSPTILVVAGAVGVVAGVVMAAKAGKTVDAKTEKEKKELETVHSKKDKCSDEVVEQLENGDYTKYTYTKMDYSRDLTHAYANLILAYVRVYGPAVITTGFSLFLIFASHRILADRFATAYAGFATMSKAYDQYRKNVIAEEGEEADKKYRFGIKAIDEETPLFDKNGNPKLDKDGNQKKAKTTKQVIGNTKFDFRSILWDAHTAHGAFDDSDCLTRGEELARIDHNVQTLLLAQNAANNRMIARANDPYGDGIGWITWEEVAQILGYRLIPKRIRKIAKDIIWLYDPRLDPNDDRGRYDPNFGPPEYWGDNRVDFGLKNPDIPGYYERQMFLSGEEEAILLYMNYDGLTYDLWK